MCSRLVATVFTYIVTRAVGQFLKIVGDLLDMDTDSYLIDSMTTQEIYKEEEVDHVKIDAIDSKAAVTVTLAAKCLELQLVVRVTVSAALLSIVSILT